MNVVALAPRARSAWPWLPFTAAPRSILIGPAGEVLRVRRDGGVDVIPAGGHPHPGVASDPTAIAQE